jgi:hypothetical protein
MLLIHVQFIQGCRQRFFRSEMERWKSLQVQNIAPLLQIRNLGNSAAGDGNYGSSSRLSRNFNWQSSNGSGGEAAKLF